MKEIFFLTLQCFFSLWAGGGEGGVKLSVS